MISAEGPPLLRAGALVDVMDALPAALRARGHDVAVALPFYREIRKNPVFHAEETGITVEVRVGDKTHNAEYLEGRSASGVQFFFVRCDELFDRPGIYGEHGGRYEITLDLQGRGARPSPDGFGISSFAYADGMSGVRTNQLPPTP